jgi:sulfotransferase family protein
LSLVFAAGTGRCGSTMLSLILNDHPDVLSLSEFFTILKDPADPGGFLSHDLDGAQLWRRLSTPVPAVDAMVRNGMRMPGLRYPYGTGRFSPDTGVPIICHGILPMLTGDPDALFDLLAAEVPGWPRRPAADQYQALFATLARAGGRRVTVERSGASLSQVRLLHDHFAGAGFVHMYRHGPDCALSMSRHPASRRAVLMEQAAQLAGLPPTASPAQVRAVLPELPAEYAGLFSGNRDTGWLMSWQIPLTAFGERWSALVRDGMAALGSLPPGSWLGLRYEDLLTAPAAELTRLAGFLGVAAPPAWLATAAKLTDPSRAGTAATQLSTSGYRALRDACEPGERAIAAAAQRHPAAAAGQPR